MTCLCKPVTLTLHKLPAGRLLTKAVLHLALCICVTGLAGLPGPAMAHREKTVFTTLQYNDRTGMLEVIHKTYAHDVEHTLGNTLRARGGLESIEAQARISLELAASFSLWDAATGEALGLELVGAELEDEFFYIYQERAMESMPQALRIRHMMLRNYWPDMSNFVNVRFSSGIGSLLFEDAVTIQEISAADAGP